MKAKFLNRKMMALLSGILILCSSVGYAENIDPGNDGSQYAYGENAGWISFSCENTGTCGTVEYGVTIDPATGVFSGKAWGENIGWITFRSTEGVTYGVTTGTVSQPTSLAGDWFFGGSDLQGNHTWDGSITVNNAGTITGGTLNSSAGPVYSITAGSLSVTSTGAVTGSFTDSDGITTQFTMQMNAQKGIMAGEGNDTTEGEDGVFIFVKKSSGFLTYNLEGEWFFGGSDLQGNHTWDGSITVENTGTITGGTLNSSAGPVYSITSGSLSVTSTGAVSGSFTDSDGVTTQFTMQMNAQKGIMAGEGNSPSENEYGVFVFVKKSSGFATNNLEGEWFFGGSDLVGNHSWDGSITVDNTGTITGGSLNSSDGPVYSITNGSLSVTSTGAVSGSFTDSDGVTTQFTMQMNAQKGIMAGEGNAPSENEDGVFVFVSCDSDSDGLSDSLENGWCTSANDADTDDDGIIDGVEDPNHNGIVDEGETDPCDADTDDDGIQDGTELGVTAGHATDTNTGIFQPDLDPSTTTNPLNPDTDADGITDGQEDTNHNGKVDSGERDPSQFNNKAMPWIPLLLLDD